MCNTTWWIITWRTSLSKGYPIVIFRFLCWQKQCCKAKWRYPPHRSFRDSPNEQVKAEITRPIWLDGVRQNMTVTWHPPTTTNWEPAALPGLWNIPETVYYYFFKYYINIGFIKFRKMFQLLFLGKIPNLAKIGIFDPKCSTMEIVSFFCAL